MLKTTLIRGVTLLVFLFFITAFVLYRAGKFDDYLTGSSPQFQTNPNGGAISQYPADTIPKPISDSVQKTILPSSKFAIVTKSSPKPADQKYSLLDSNKLKEFLESIKKTPEKRMIMMSSSKSGHVILVDDPFFMPSSKSTTVFVPRKKLEPTVPKYNRDSLRLRLGADSATYIKR